MKKDQVRVGAVYTAKVSGGIAEVRITGEKWKGEKHVGWEAVNTATNRPVRIRSAQRLRAAVGKPAAPATASPTTPHAAAAPDPKFSKRRIGWTRG